jgi:aspartate/methionine/tyrosine aminotransferase
MNNFPKLAMARFSEQVSEQFKDKDLISMHGTNPEPFTQIELEDTVGRSFNSILKNVNLGFSPDEGTLALRTTLAAFQYESITAQDVITHAGAQEALFCSFHALLQANDKVLAVAPIFEPLVQIPFNIGCKVSYVHLDSDNMWSLNLESVETHFKRGCKLFIINFPHNPTGATLTESELMVVVNLCKKYDVWLLSDEVFRGLEHSLDYRLPAVADIYEKGISIGVISKGFAIPGIRIGWLACQNKVFRSRIIDIKGYISICNSQVDELLASVILKNTNKINERNLKIILKNKNLLNDLNSLLGYGINVNIPNVGCCVFATLNDVDSLGALSLVNLIANQTGYLLYPSDIFKSNEQALRIGFGSKEYAKFSKET